MTKKSPERLSARGSLALRERKDSTAIFACALLAMLTRDDEARKDLCFLICDVASTIFAHSKDRAAVIYRCYTSRQAERMQRTSALINHLSGIVAITCLTSGCDTSSQSPTDSPPETLQDLGALRDSRPDATSRDDQGQTPRLDLGAMDSSMDASQELDAEADLAEMETTPPPAPGNCPLPQGAQTHLEAAAASLAPGQACMLQSDLYGEATRPDRNDSSSMTWAASAAWIELARQLRWTGRAAGCHNTSRPFVHLVFALLCA